MFQVIVEYTQTWPTEGPLWLETPKVKGEIQISPESARRRANGYLARYVALALEVGNPVLVWRERPIWRMSIYLSLPGFDRVAELGMLDVDATTRAVYPLTNEQIAHLQDRADEFSLRFTPASEPTS